jgi:alpha-L-rhamnosidase
MSVSSPPSGLTPEDIECLVVHSETTLKGHFTSSNPIVNQIQHNIQWGQLSNIMSLPTDSPQRDERRGYLGDAALSADEALYNFDLIKFYLNFLNLIVDIQLPDGELPDLAPGGEYPADTNFGSALPTITWLLYQHYGDAKILEAYYNSIRSYVEFLIGVHNKSSLAKFFCAVGDWVPPPPHVRTNCHLLSSFGFLHDVNILVNISQVLGRQNDTEFYSALYQQLAKEFHLAFFNTSTNFYADGMQAAQVLALALPAL